MKDKRYTDIICKLYCDFYKEGKEEMHCMTYKYLKEKFSPDELSSEMNDVKEKRPAFSFDSEIQKEICKKCDFIEDGCDYREGLSSPPCGGYKIVEELKKKGSL